MQVIRQLVRLLDDYGLLWFAIAASVVVLYYYAPLIRAAHDFENHRWEQVRLKDQREIDANHERLTNGLARHAAIDAPC